MDRPLTARVVAGRSAAWLARALAVGVAVLFLGGPPDPVADQPLGAGFWVIGGTILAGVLATLRPTRRLGTVLFWLGLWALFTLYGVTALTDPHAVIADSQLSTRPSRRLSSDAGAYALGVAALLIANVPVVTWLWSRTPFARTRRQRRRELRTVGDPVPSDVVRGPSEEAERIQDRRHLARRRRKRRLERR